MIDNNNYYYVFIYLVNLRILSIIEHLDSYYKHVCSLFYSLQLDNQDIKHSYYDKCT